MLHCATRALTRTQPHGAVIGIDSFGASAPADQLFKHYGFTVEKVIAAAKGL